MDKQRILELAKIDIKQLVDEMTLTQIPQTREKVFSYLMFLTELDRLPVVTSVETEQELPKQTTEDKLTKVKHVMDTFFDEPEKISQAVEPVKVPYRFERKLKGGWLPNIQAFVPERMVRELELSHGDLVYASKLTQKSQTEGPTRYSFELAERRNESEPKDRVQINYAIVDWDVDIKRFVVSSTISEGMIRDPDGVPMTLLISDQEANDLKIKEGDIVDVAYHTGQSSVVRLIWRYSMDNPAEFQWVTANKKKHYKPTTTTQREYPQTLSEMTVLMIGFEPGKKDMEEEIVRRGGTMIWASGREGHDRIFTMVNKSDCVINMLAHMGHSGSISAVDIAKTLDIPHGRVHNFGRSSFIQEIYRCLGITSAE